MTDMMKKDPVEEVASTGKEEEKPVLSGEKYNHGLLTSTAWLAPRVEVRP